MRFRALVLSLGALFLVACSSAGAPTDAQTSPEKVVNAFFSLYMAGDRSAALDLVAADSRDLLDGELSGMESEGWVYKSVSVESVEGNEVTVQMDITIDGDEDTGTDQVEVVEQDGKWWIVDLPS